MKTPRVLKRNGFTLVELLVVIVIIAALAGLSFSILPRIQRKAKATASMSNLRQFAPVLTGYATEHSMMLPPILGPVKDSEGIEQELTWVETALLQLNPDTAVNKFRDKQWWETTKPFAQNPLYTSWSPQTPGYAMNAKLAENVEAGKESGAATDTIAISVPLAAIPEPARTPLVAPGTAISYRYDMQTELNQFKGAAKELLVEDKLMILFVDGHVESVTPTEYIDRELHMMPAIN